MYFGALCKKETMLGLTYLRNQTKISYFFILVQKMNHILQECHHDYNGNLVDTNTKKKVWSVCPFLLDGIYSSLCESVMRTTGNKKFKVFSHNISCIYIQGRELEVWNIWCIMWRNEKLCSHLSVNNNIMRIFQMTCSIFIILFYVVFTKRKSISICKLNI